MNRVQNIVIMSRFLFFFVVLLFFSSSCITPNTFKDKRDGKVYTTVKIGNQIWMAENLAYLPNVISPATGSSIEPYYYVLQYYGTDVSAAKETDNYKTYGVLYNWTAALTACPPGWHLPTDSEWKILEIYLANNGYNYDGFIGLESGSEVGDKIGKAMASESIWLSYTGFETGTVGKTDYPNQRNKSGFSALPGGYRKVGEFTMIWIGGYWWSSTEGWTNRAWGRCLYWNNSNLHRQEYEKTTGRSVRCVRD